MANRYFIGGMTYDEAVERFEQIASEQLSGAALNAFAESTLYEICEGDSFVAHGVEYTLCYATDGDEERDDLWAIELSPETDCRFDFV